MCATKFVNVLVSCRVGYDVIMAINYGEGSGRVYSVCKKERNEQKKHERRRPSHRKRKEGENKKQRVRPQKKEGRKQDG